MDWFSRCLRKGDVLMTGSLRDNFLVIKVSRKLLRGLISDVCKPHKCVPSNKKSFLFYAL